MMTKLQEQYESTLRENERLLAKFDRLRKQIQSVLNVWHADGDIIALSAVIEPLGRAEALGEAGADGNTQGSDDARSGSGQGPERSTAPAPAEPSLTDIPQRPDVTSEPDHDRINEGTCRAEQHCDLRTHEGRILRCAFRAGWDAAGEREGYFRARAEKAEAERDEALAQVAEVRSRVIALATYDMCSGWVGGSMECRDDEFGDWLSAYSVHEIVGYDPTEPTETTNGE